MSSWNIWQIHSLKCSFIMVIELWFRQYYVCLIIYLPFVMSSVQTQLLRNSLGWRWTLAGEMFRKRKSWWASDWIRVNLWRKLKKKKKKRNMQRKIFFSQLYFVKKSSYLENVYNKSISYKACEWAAWAC